MVVKIKRALLIAGRFYQPGVKDIPEKDLKHPHFVRYIKLGIVVPPDAEELEAAVETPVMRAERFLAKEKELQAKREELLKKVEAPAKPVDEKPADEGKKSKKG